MGDRREMLQQFVNDHPEDAFARYGLALEMARAGETEAALEEFDRLAERHPDYAAGHQQAAQLLLARQRFPEARVRLERGIDAARRQGDTHAVSEMQGMLDEVLAHGQ